MTKLSIIDYEYGMEPPDKFDIKLKMITTNKMFKSIFKKGSKALRKKGVVDVQEEFDFKDIKKIEINPKYYPILRRHFTGIIRNIERDCMRIEKVKFIAWNIQRIDAIRKDDGNWSLEPKIDGNYVDL